MLGQPALVARHDRRDAQGEALLAEQGVAAVARAEAPDLAGGGEVDDVLVVGVARPGHVGLALLQGRAEGVQAGHPVAVAQDVEGLLPHAGHDPHADGDVGRVGQLHADVGDGRPERAHREGHDVEGAALHGARVELGHVGAHLVRGAPVVGGSGVFGIVGADERAVLDPGDVGRVGVGPVAVRTLGLVEPGERARGDQLRGQPVVLLGRAVAPVDRVGLQHCGPLVDPVLESLVAGRRSHVGSPEGGGMGCTAWHLLEAYSADAPELRSRSGRPVVAAQRL